MTRAYLLVERSSDEAFVRKVLPSHFLQEVEVVPAGGDNEIPSLARTLLVRRKRPVVVLSDADSTAPDAIEERRKETEDLIRSADASVPAKVIVAIPEIESWFFAAPESLERVLGKGVSEEWLALGLGNPRRAIQWLAKRNGADWNISRAIEQLTERDIERIRTVPEVEELCAFLEAQQLQDQVR